MTKGKNGETRNYKIPSKLEAVKAIVGILGEAHVRAQLEQLLLLLGRIRCENSDTLYGNEVAWQVRLESIHQ